MGLAMGDTARQRGANQQQAAEQRARFLVSTYAL